jgi:hypothetical protein
MTLPSAANPENEGQNSTPTALNPLLGWLSQSPPEWVQSEDGRFNRQTDHDHHQESQSVNVGTIQEQWLS